MANPLRTLNNPIIPGLSRVGGGAYLRSGNNRVPDPRVPYHRP